MRPLLGGNLKMKKVVKVCVLFVCKRLSFVVCSLQLSNFHVQCKVRSIDS